jgi:hypothetical protein
MLCSKDKRQREDSEEKDVRMKERENKKKSQWGRFSAPVQIDLGAYAGLLGLVPGG